MKNKDLEKALKKQHEEFDKWFKTFMDAKTAYEISIVLSKNKTGSTFNENHPEGKKALNKLNKFKKDKIVQQALVKYWPGTDLCDEIFFSSKDKLIRLAYLESERWNAHWHSFLGPDKKFSKFLNAATDEELYVYFTNKNFKLLNFEYLLDRVKPYDKISEKMYRNIIMILEDNPNQKKEPNSLDYDDGMLWHSDLRAYEKFQKELIKIKKLKNLE